MSLKYSSTYDREFCTASPNPYDREYCVLSPNSAMDYVPSDEQTTKSKYPLERQYVPLATEVPIYDSSHHPLPVGQGMFIGSKSGIRFYIKLYHSEDLELVNKMMPNMIVQNSLLDEDVDAASVTTHTRPGDRRAQLPSTSQSTGSNLGRFRTLFRRPNRHVGAVVNNESLGASARPDNENVYDSIEMKSFAPGLTANDPSKAKAGLRFSYGCLDKLMMEHCDISTSLLPNADKAELKHFFVMLAKYVINYLYDNKLLKSTEKRNFDNEFEDSIKNIHAIMSRLPQGSQAITEPKAIAVPKHRVPVPPQEQSDYDNAKVKLNVRVYVELVNLVLRNLFTLDAWLQSIDLSKIDAKQLTDLDSAAKHKWRFCNINTHKGNYNLQIHGNFVNFKHPLDKLADKDLQDALYSYVLTHVPSDLDFKSSSEKVHVVDFNKLNVKDKIELVKFLCIDNRLKILRLLKDRADLMKIQNKYNAVSLSDFWEKMGHLFSCMFHGISIDLSDIIPVDCYINNNFDNVYKYLSSVVLAHDIESDASISIRGNAAKTDSVDSAVQARIEHALNI